MACDARRRQQSRKSTAAAAIYRIWISIDCDCGKTFGDVSEYRGRLTVGGLDLKRGVYTG